jgi:hypothetical protein
MITSFASATNIEGLPEFDQTGLSNVRLLSKR